MLLRLVPLLALVFASCAPFAAAASPTGAVPVKLQQDAAGRWTLLRGGQPYFIRGAGGSSHHELIPQFGGNSLRTWHVWQLEPRDEQGRNMIDRAHELGLTMTVGIWVQQARRGFKFDGGPAVQKQRDMVRNAVRKYRDHPATLVWGLGNEVEIAVSPDNPALWGELNELAKIVKAEDPDHPVMTIIAGAHPDKVKVIMQYYPEIDILGVNAYGENAAKTPEILKSVGWTKPWVFTEFGPSGPWSARKMEWNAPIEPTGEQKVKMYRAGWEAAIKADDGQFLGGYAFIWGHKQEATQTWFGMFLPTGERTAAVDVVKQLWTGEWPADLCPEITDWTVPLAEQTVAPGAEFTVAVEARDPEGRPLVATWWVMAEASRPKIGGDREAVPQTFPEAIVRAEGMQAVVRAPAPGNYRLFVKVVDPANGTSVRNTPFRVAAPAAAAN